MPGVIFLIKFVKVASVLETPRSLWFPKSGDPLQTRFCYFFILLQLFIRPKYYLPRAQGTLATPLIAVE